MPFALGLIRRLGEAGHEVLASDSYAAAPGSHSRYVTRHFVTPQARADPRAFAAEVDRIAGSESVDAIVPAWEDVFYLAALRPRSAPLFAASFAALARLHDKERFRELVVSLGLPVPDTALATSRAELREALGRWPHYFARAVYSRGGQTLLTNTGPLAGHVSPDDIEPTPEAPWLVQEFVDGPMVCTYSTARDGRMTAHCAYRAPRQWEHSTGIQFLSIEPAESLAVAERIAGELGFTGQLSFDFVESAQGLTLIECNPRTTDGVLLMAPAQVAGGILDPAQQLTCVPAGVRVQLDFAVFADLFREPLREVPHGFGDLLHIRDASSGWHDHLPTLYSFLALAHHERLSLRERKALFAAMSADVCWDGEPIAGMGAEDRAVLRAA
jgi:hypothetical protein